MTKRFQIANITSESINENEVGLCQYHFRVSCHVVSMSNVKYQESDVICQMSDVRCQMSDVRCQMSDVRCQMTDDKCQMSDDKCKLLVPFNF